MAKFTYKNLITCLIFLAITTNISIASKHKSCTRGIVCENMGGECVKHSECKISKYKLMDKNWSGDKSENPKNTGRVKRGSIVHKIKNWWKDWTIPKGLCGEHGCVCCTKKETAPSCPTSASCWRDNNYRGTCVRAGECVPPSTLAPSNTCLQDTTASCQCCLRHVECAGRETDRCKKFDGRCTDSCQKNEAEIVGGCISNMCKCCAPSACKPRTKCTKKNGSCVMDQKDCSGTILEKGCSGTGCLCCINP